MYNSNATANLLYTPISGELQSCLSNTVLATVAQLAVRPTGDQEVAGSTPAGLATFFCGD